MKTWYMTEKLCKHATGEASWTMPTAVYIGLLTEDPTVSGLTTNEVVGGSYARQEITFEFDMNSYSSKNTAAVTFTDLPACTIKYWAIFDASTAGNMLWYEPTNNELIVPLNMDLHIDIGNLIYREA